MDFTIKVRCGLQHDVKSILPVFGVTCKRELIFPCVKFWHSTSEGILCPFRTKGIHRFLTCFLFSDRAHNVSDSVMIGYTPIFDLFPLQPRRVDLSVERSDLPSANPVGVTSTIYTPIWVCVNILWNGIIWLSRILKAGYYHHLLHRWNIQARFLPNPKEWSLWKN